MGQFRISDEHGFGPWARINAQGRCAGFFWKEGSLSNFASAALASADLAKAMELGIAESSALEAMLPSLELAKTAAPDDDEACNDHWTVLDKHQKCKWRMKALAAAKVKEIEPALSAEEKLAMPECWVAVSDCGRFLVESGGCVAFGRNVLEATMFPSAERGARMLAKGRMGQAVKPLAMGAKLVRLALSVQESLSPDTMKPSLNAATGLMMSMVEREAMSKGSAAKGPGANPSRKAKSL